MSHALAEPVTAEQFRLYGDNVGGTYLGCSTCPWLGPPEDTDVRTVGDALAAARVHIAEAHPAPETHTIAHPADRHDGDANEALIPEPAGDPGQPLRVCEKTGNAIRTALVPIEINGERKWYCRWCFGRHTRNVAGTELPVWPQDRATDVTRETP